MDGKRRDGQVTFLSVISSAGADLFVFLLFTFDGLKCNVYVYDDDIYYTLLVL
jgi:hypothetical protein